MDVVGLTTNIDAYLDLHEISLWQRYFRGDNPRERWHLEYKSRPYKLKLEASGEPYWQNTDRQWHQTVKATLTTNLGHVPALPLPYVFFTNLGGTLSRTTPHRSLMPMREVW